MRNDKYLGALRARVEVMRFVVVIWAMCVEDARWLLRQKAPASILPGDWSV